MPVGTNDCRPSPDIRIPADQKLSHPEFSIDHQSPSTDFRGYFFRPVFRHNTPDCPVNCSSPEPAFHLQKYILQLEARRVTGQTYSLVNRKPAYRSYSSTSVARKYSRIRWPANPRSGLRKVVCNRSKSQFLRY